MDPNRSLLEQARELYEETRNPLYAWQAYHAAQRLRKPIPEWVATYLDRVALNLMFLSRKEGRTRDWLGPALELGEGRGGDAWRRQFMTTVRKQVMQDYERARAADPQRSNFDIFSELSERYKLRSTVDGKAVDKPLDHARIAKWIGESRKKLDQ